MNKPIVAEVFRPRLIFFDVDGTLLNTEGQYSSYLEDQLNRLHLQGIKLAIASGRPSIATQFLFDELPITAAGLFCTGAELYDPSTAKHIQLHCLPSDVLAHLYPIIKRNKLYCEFYTPDFYTTEDTGELSRIHSHHLRVEPRVMSGSAVLEQCLPVTKLLVGAHEASQGDQLRQIAAEFEGTVEFAFAHFLAYPGWLFASVIDKRADKQQGFDRLLDYHNVSASEVMAFGDSHSDKVFLQRAGLGVAMGNARPEIHAVADMTTVHCDQDGVAKVLASIV